jgi:hypothetical protein
MKREVDISSDKAVAVAKLLNIKWAVAVAQLKQYYKT